MRQSIDMRAKLVRDAGAGLYHGEARLDRIELEARRQIRDAVDQALRDHGIQPERDSEKLPGEPVAAE